MTFKGRGLDLVRRFFPDAISCINEFDFTVTMAAVRNDGMFYYTDEFFEHLAYKVLIINRLNYPLSTMKRVHKYLKKGFRICDGGMLKIAEAIKNTDIQEQLKPNELYPSEHPVFIGMD